MAPLGFEISDKQLKRAGLDYWPLLKYQTYENFGQWLKKRPLSPQTWFFSARGDRSLYEIAFQPGDTLVFGKEDPGPWGGDFRPARRADGAHSFSWAGAKSEFGQCCGGGGVRGAPSNKRPLLKPLFLTPKQSLKCKSVFKAGAAR